MIEARYASPSVPDEQGLVPILDRVAKELSSGPATRWRQWMRSMAPYSNRRSGTTLRPRNRRRRTCEDIRSSPNC
jgi:hypothetical protein